MEPTTKKPLAASNIPRPSLLPARSGVGKKRTAHVAQLEEEHVLPPSKRAARGEKTVTAKVPAGKSKTVAVKHPPPTRNVVSTRKQSSTVAASGSKAKTQTLKGNEKRPMAGKSSINSKKLQSCEGRMDVEVLDKLEKLSSRMSKLEAEKAESKHTDDMHQEGEKFHNILEQLSETRRLLTESEHNLELAKMSKASLQRAYNDAETNLTGACQEISTLKLNVSQMVTNATVAHSQLEAMKLSRDKELQESQCKSERIADLEKEIEKLRSSLLQCHKEIRENESTRRKLHNTIQELKGNIRVFCRMRPLLHCELNNSALDGSTASTDTTSICCTSVGSQPVIKGDRGSFLIEFPDKEKECRKISIHFSPHKVDGHTSKRSTRTQQYEFEFDRVFGPDCSQEAVFSEISQLVQSALDGYNVCIFAYGQTGSGKTYTMEGPVNADEHTQGMIPRALQQVFTSSRDLNEKGWVVS
ncbi:Kinesin-like protein KIN-14N [Geodia barretti]|uniref:Kinesin-like protein KIN-14N n=1 Tax=Geodia barretti TaxID=519541 RepID=A0AA35S057_GEOBA|nr:Kinesin-like protein KIN-14N [Geodia barretti]